MKFGTYMFEAKKVPGFDFDLFRVKPEVGRRMPPKADMYSNIAIFGDNVTARIHPDWISQSDLGPAWRTNDNYNVRWEVLCATQPESPSRTTRLHGRRRPQKPRNLAKQHPLRRTRPLHMPTMQRTTRKKRTLMV